MDGTFDFSGWATRNDVLCTDGRTIRQDAFKHCDGKSVPLVWNHFHNSPENILGTGILEHRDNGVYVYGRFNETPSGKAAKILLQHGDITSLSIHANRLKQTNRGDVLHGEILEVSLVIAGANPKAKIENVLMHGEMTEEEATISMGDEYSEIGLHHADVEKDEEEKNMADNKEKTADEKNGKTVKEVFDTLNEEQQKAVYYVIGQALKDKDSEAKHSASEEEDEEMAHSASEGGNLEMNAFEGNGMAMNRNVLTHADQESIIEMAKKPGVGTLKEAIRQYAAETENDELSHGIDEIETLFPDYKLVKPGAPELLQNDLGWVGHVMQKTHKSPISRIRTRQADARIAELRAKGYQNKGDYKKLSGDIKLLSRTTDPQTVYRKDVMNRDDIIDITDFDVVAYQWGIMKDNLNEEIATAVMIGDGREDGDPDKIHESHIRSIWNDEELYTMHYDVDIAKAKSELNGTNTSANFGDNYIYAEAIITAALYSREKFKGTGTPDLYCTPHMVNVMLLARDLNGRRIYDSKADLAAALNVGAIHTAEQFEGKVRTDANGKKHKLLGLFVNLADYQIGATKGGELTKFDDFDIDFNQYKYMLETRLSGALTRVYSAIALEEPVVEAAVEDGE